MIVISGPSGVGKDTVMQRLLKARESFRFVVTATTRPPRADEVHGVDYFFLSHEEFQRMIREDELLEYALVYKQYKGVPKQQVRDALASGRDVVMRVDVQGAATIRKLVPDGIFIFLTAESEESLKRRLRLRRSESEEALNLRLQTAREEMMRVAEFDYCVVNSEGDQDKAVRDILCIVDSEHLRVHREPIIL